MWRNSLLAIFTFSSFIASTANAETFAPALGARAAGRSGTNLAFDDNAFVFSDNPAGLIGATYGKDVRSTSILECNIAGLFPDLKYSDPQNSNAHASNDPFGLGAFTYAKRVNDDLALGFGVYSLSANDSLQLLHCRFWTAAT